MKKPELLAPAGDMERLLYAIEYGADSVYLAGNSFGMRAAAGNFSNDELAVAIRTAHEHGRRVCITVNVMASNSEIGALPQYLQMLNDIGADAIIAADLGVMALVKRYAPSVELHISTQASITNYEAAQMYHNIGAKRVVLARELSLDAVAEIRAKVPRELELETFVHGSMCMSYSGRCMLSNYLTGRDANHGACAQPCRWNYAVAEERRPGEYYPVEQDERGTYIFNSKDMCMIEHIPQLVNAGIDCFKIEGRAKTFYYAAVVTSAYRRAIDLYFSNPQGYTLPNELLEEVDKVSHRHYFTGFYFGDTDSQYPHSSQYIRNYDVCAVVDSCTEDGMATLYQRNKFFAGDVLELFTPDGKSVELCANEIFNGDMQPVESTPHAEMKLHMRLPHRAPKMSILRKKII